MTMMATPASCPPVFAGLDLATPVTLAEWFEGFYPAAASEAPYKQAIVEAVVRAGEVMFVPRGTCVSCVGKKGTTRRTVRARRLILDGGERSGQTVRIRSDQHQ